MEFPFFFYISSVFLFEFSFISGSHSVDQILVSFRDHIFHDSYNLGFQRYQRDGHDVEISSVFIKERLSVDQWSVFINSFLDSRFGNQLSIHMLTVSQRL